MLNFRVPSDILGNAGEPLAYGDTETCLDEEEEGESEDYPTDDSSRGTQRENIELSEISRAAGADAAELQLDTLQVRSAFHERNRSSRSRITLQPGPSNLHRDDSFDGRQASGMSDPGLAAIRMNTRRGCVVLITT